ncbi:MAG: sensor domain-containing diguanylate cyclase [Candidatus Rokubacteria bacterium]|nr:sensor domain-containing diguanylate cyclase [Candidatus Rokubacteria bacterium]
MTRPNRWQVLFAISGGLCVVIGWELLPAPAAALLLALGGGLFGLAVAPRLWRGASPTGSADTERLEAMLTTFQEGMLDLYSLVELGRTISASLDLDQIFTTTMKRVAETTGVESYALFLHDETANSLIARTVSGTGTEVLQDRSFALSEGLAGRVYQSGTPEAHTADGPLPWPDVPAHARSVVALPLASPHRSLGVLLLYSPTPEAFSERQTAYFTAVAKQLAIAVENAELFVKTKELTYRDALTGLFNRRYFEETLEREVRRALRYKLPVSLLMADIDHFKIYNDTHGHHQGDLVLKEVAARLTENTRQVDVVSRYGGEELVVVLPMTTKTHARLVAEKLRRSVEETKIPGEEVLPGGRLTISLGLAAYPEDASNPTALIQAADAALYTAKRKGRNRTEIFGRS